MHVELTSPDFDLFSARFDPTFLDPPFTSPRVDRTSPRFDPASVRFARIWLEVPPARGGGWREEGNARRVWTRFAQTRRAGEGSCLLPVVPSFQPTGTGAGIGPTGSGELGPGDFGSGCAGFGSWPRSFLFRFSRRSR